MSKQVDQRVVSMQFDNKHFERNVQTSMSTLDKLKEKLSFKGATKGLEDVGTAANKVNMSGLSKGVETVSAKFSALQVMGVTALANLTNSAVNAGKRIVESLTIAPVKDGFSEYEMMLNSVQTTMAGTGKTAAEVENELKKLDEYADKTVYSTSDMLNNLPKFTNAGVELEKATTAMIGIANATALAGGDASKASIAFYNLGQAIGTGYLTRMDYNSINNAGIATMEWKNQMVEAAIAQGTLTKVGEDSYKAGNKTLTLQQLFIDGLQEQWATTDVMMKVFGDYGDETTEIGKKAYSAAQDIKTYSQMMESLKATAGTGWKDTWQIIFGGLEEAKEFWTGLTNFISGIITKMADFRNKVLGGAFARGFTGLAKKISSILDPIKKTADVLKGATKTAEDYEKVVKEIINGKWGHTQKRWNALTEAGYDWAHAQNLVNERLGCSLRRATDYGKAQSELNKEQSKSSDVQSALSATEAERLEQLIAMSDAELKALGYTQEQIDALRELERWAKKLGLPLSEFIANLDEIDGRWLFFKSFENVGKSIVTIFKAIGQAFKEVFNVSEDSLANGLFNVIAALHKFTTYLKVSDEAADKFKRTFKGVFALLKIVLTIVGGPIKIAFKILGQLLAAFDIPILDLTASIGDAIVKFSDWLESVLDFTAVFKKMVPYVKAAGEYLGKLFKSVKNSETFKNIASIFKNAANGVKEWFEGLKEAENIPKYIISGLAKGLWNGIKTVSSIIAELATKLITVVKDILGIHSPSTVFIAIGGFIMLGLIKGIQNMSPDAVDAIGGVASDIINFIKGIDIGQIFSMVMSTGLITSLLNFSSGFKNMTEPLGSLGDMLEDVGKGVKRTLTGFKKTLKGLGSFLSGLGRQFTAKAIKDIAIAIAILVGAIFVLTLIDTKKALIASGVVIALVAAVAFLAKSMGKLTPKQAAAFGKTTIAILAISGALVLMGIALKIVSGIPWQQLLIAGGALVALGGIIVGLIAATKLAGKNINKIAIMLSKLGGALLLMGIAIKILGSMTWDKLAIAGAAIGGLGVLIAGLIAATKLAGKDGFKAAGVISKLGKTLLLMAIAVAILGMMSWESLGKAGAAMAGLSILIAGLIAATKLAGKDIDKAATVISKIGVALLLMAIAAQIVSMMSWESIGKAMACIAGFGAIIVGLVWATKLAGKGKIDKVGTTLIAMAGAIAVMAATAMLLSFIEPADLAKGVIVVGFFGLIVSGMVKSTKGAKNCMANLIVMTIAIAVMAAAIAALSVIDPIRLAAATAALTVATTAFSKLVQSTNKVGKSMGSLIALTVAIGVLGGVLYLVGTLPAKQSIVASIALALLIETLANVMEEIAKIRVNGKKMFTAIGGLAALAGVMAVLGGVLVMMSALKVNNAIEYSVVLIGLLSSLMGIAYAITKLKINSSKVLKASLGLVALAGVLAVLGGVLGMMSVMKVTNAIPNAVALSTLIAVLTGVAAALSLIGNASKGILMGALGLAALAGVMALLALVLAMMSAMKVDNAMSNAMVLSALIIVLTGVATVLALVGNLANGIFMGALGLAALAGVMALLGLVLAMMTKLKVGKAITNAMALNTIIIVLTGVATVLALVGNLATGILMGAVGLAALTGVMALLGLVLAMMTAMKVNNAVTNAMALNTMIIVLTGVATVLALVGNLATGILMGAVGLAALTGAMALLGLVLAMMTALKVEDSIANAIALAILMDTLANICVKIALVAPLALIGVVALAALTYLIGVIGVFAVAVGALMTKFPTLKNFLSTGLPILVQVAGGIGEMIGAFVSGVMTKLSAGLPEVGANLSEFMTNAMPFIEGAKLVDSSVLTGVGILAGAILALTAVDLLTNIASFLTFGSSFADLGVELSEFIGAAMPFITGIQSVSPAVLQGVKALAEAILILTATNVIEGLTSWFAGETSISDFGKELAKLGPHLRTFVDSLGTITPEQVSSVSCACETIKKLAEAAKELPNEGGLIAGIVGDNGIAGFADNLPGLGWGISQFIRNLGKFDNSQLDTVDIACEAVKKLAEAAKELPNDGGLIGLLAGNNGIAGFANNLPGLGWGVSGFITNLGGFDSSKRDTVATACEAIIHLANAAKAIPNSDGLWQKIAGEKSLASFADKLPGLGINLATFINHCANITPGVDMVSVINTVVHLMNGLYLLSKAKLNANFSKLADNLGKYLDKLKSAVYKVESVSVPHYEQVFNMTDQLRGMAQLLATDDFSGFSRLTDALNDYITNGLTCFDVASSWDVSATMNAYVDKLTNAFIGRLAQDKENIKTAANNVVLEAVEYIQRNDMLAAWQWAGYYLTKGFSDGITANQYLATDAGSALGKAALAAAKKALDEHSPSREMYKVGDYAGLGFVNALRDHVSTAFAAGSEIADSVKSGLGGAIAKISDAINGDLDTQPTIRPVLDLSDVRSGANAIGGMFSGRRTLSVDTSSIGSLSFAMSKRQNGDSELASEFRALRRDLADSPRTSYNINGITYDDGSNISEAVKTLVRAARVERRI